MQPFTMDTSVRKFLQIALALGICAVAVTVGQHSSYYRNARSGSDSENAPNFNAIDADPVGTDASMPLSSTEETPVPATTAAAAPTAATTVQVPGGSKSHHHRSPSAASRAHRKALRQARKGKSRRKRRGCKCVQRYMQDVDKMIEAKLQEFKEVYLLPKLKDSNAQRMRDALLRLSGDVDETKNGLRKLTDSVARMLDDFQSSQRDFDRTARQVHRVGSAVANLSQYVDSMERRIASSGLQSMRFMRNPQDITASQIAHMETSTQPKPLPTQCNDVLRSASMHYLGDYYSMIKPHGVPHAFKALCKNVNNSGWTVIQKRQDGSVDFFRGWDDYRVGFGSLEGEFWLGNDNIHHLTSQEDTMLRIEMEDWNGKKYFAVYNYFRVDGNEENFTLHLSGYEGNAGDAMNSLWENHDGMPFSTKDKDNDYRFYDSCATQYSGAWWFNNCFEAHLNGKYYTKGFHKNYFQRDGIMWNSIHMYSSLKAVQMMVKPAEKPRGATSNTDRSAGGV